MFDQWDSRAEFSSTAWTLIRQAQTLSTDERCYALDAVLGRYWKPIYAFFRAKGKSTHDAEDLVQGFLESFVEGRDICRVDPCAGRFRDWLVVCARNYMLDVERRQAAQKRRPPGRLISLESLCVADGDGFESAAQEDPERAFRDAWRRDILQRAIASVRLECDQLGKQMHYQVFVDYYLGDEQPRPTWKEVAARHHFSDWKDTARKANWVRGRLAEAIRAEVAFYANSDEAVDEEIRCLCQ